MSQSSSWRDWEHDYRPVHGCSVANTYPHFTKKSPSVVAEDDGFRPTVAMDLDEIPYDRGVFSRVYNKPTQWRDPEQPRISRSALWRLAKDDRGSRMHRASDGSQRCALDSTSGGDNPNVGSCSPATAVVQPSQSCCSRGRGSRESTRGRMRAWDD
mmetsp:Transcript_8927/g.19493  ORF Transcript_8927/g.19493 Transcript_8927/m.19493 type:complete len:156 (-) Transcript_8927:2-469(-)